MRTDVPALRLPLEQRWPNTPALCELAAMGDAVKTISLPVERATPEALAGYGFVIGRPDSEVRGRIDYYGDKVKVRTPVQFVSNNDMTLNLVSFNRREPVIRWMEYHSKHTQTFIPLSGKSFVMVLGKPTRRRPDGSMDESQPDLPDLTNVRAFYFDGSCGVCMHVGTWHEVPFPLQDDTHFVAIVTHETNRNLEQHDAKFFEADGGDLLKRNLQHRFGAQFHIDLATL
jgi:ureidoglycolate lyase